MIKIVKKGCDKIFIKMCDKCLSDFTYQSDDTHYKNITWWVKCPECDNACVADWKEVDEKGEKYEVIR